MIFEVSEVFIIKSDMYKYMFIVPVISTPLINTNATKANRLEIYYYRPDTLKGNNAATSLWRERRNSDSHIHLYILVCTLPKIITEWFLPQDPQAVYHVLHNNQLVCFNAITTKFTNGFMEFSIWKKGGGTRSCQHNNSAKSVLWEA